MRLGIWGAAILTVAACRSYANPMLDEAAPGNWVPTFMAFSGLDAMRGGGFAHAGLIWSPRGLDQSGFVLKGLVGAGRYSYISGSTGITGHNMLAAIMPGWRFKTEASELTFFAGLDFQDHRLTPADPANRISGTHLGLRAGLEYWSEPLPDMMLTGAASASTIGGGYWTRAALGWRLFDTMWAGPEIQALGDAWYRQFRIGAHVTSFRTGFLEWSAGLGFAEDAAGRSGAYGRIGVLARR